jgi:Ca2+-transporting ATPase
MVTKGEAEGIVVATGMETQMGQIANLLGGGKQDTPLEKRLTQLGKYLVLFCGAVCALVVILGLLRGEPLEQMVMLGISLAVAAIPEGLPAIVTIALALGVQRMSQRRAIVRQLPAVETLGCVSTICADKTGTLTANALTVQTLYLAGKKITVSGIGYEPTGDFYQGGRKLTAAADPTLALALEIAVLCNKAELQKGSGRRKQQWAGTGDPTEIALLVLAGKGGIWREALAKKGFELVSQRAFDSTRKMMSVLSRSPEGRFLTLTKGAPEVILQKCGKKFEQNRILPLNAEAKRQIKAVADEFADEAMRVLALAWKGWQVKPAEDWEQDLVFVGLVGMADHPREGVSAAIAKARSAGIRTIMITGDHVRTAVATAAKLGMRIEEGQVWEEAQLAKLSPPELRKVVSRAKVFARVTPKRKLDIVKALKESGEIVAMTGDGVNDAPALQEAHVGVAMGRSGTDVAREAAKVVLTDDNFATIVAAIEEGRSIYENIRKFIRYLLGCNVGEILVMLLASILGLPAPLLPIQLLWLNLVTDGLPAMALGLEPPERALMEEPPRQQDEGIFSRGLLKKIIWQGIIVGGGAIVAFIIALNGSNWNLGQARTVAFSTLVFSQLAFAFRCRWEHRFAADWQGNPMLLFSVLISATMQFLVLSWRPLAVLFRTASLEAWQWWLIFLFSSWPLLLGQWLQSFLASFGKRLSMVKIS